MIIELSPGETVAVTLKITWKEAQALKKIVDAGLKSGIYSEEEELTGDQYVRTISKIKIG